MKKTGTKCLVADSGPATPFRVQVEYKDMKPDLDRRLRKIVGREEAGSGFFFGTRTRDIGWTYSKRFAAEAAVKRIKAARIRGVQVELLVDEEDV